MFWVVVTWMGKGANALLSVCLMVAQEGIAMTAEVMVPAKNNIDRFFINNGSYKMHNIENGLCLVG
jgi:hypothetical protein